MIFDKTLLFADGLEIPAAANKTTYGKAVDLRLNGDIGMDGGLKVYGQIVGAANTAGAITTVVETSATDPDSPGTTWEAVASQTQSGNLLIGMFLPFGLKRYVRLGFKTGGTALSGAVKVKAGLVDQFDQDAAPKLQSYPPLEDLAAGA